jgi:hypothetical protein
MKTFLFFITVSAFLLLPACEEAEDITGDSFLEIVNDCEYSVKIYFDGTYIGRVSSEEDETWSVPSGQHTVEAKCSFADDFKQSFNFVAGSTTVVRLEITSKYKSQEAAISGKCYL